MNAQEKQLSDTLTILAIQGYIVPITVREAMLRLLEREAAISYNSGVIAGMMAARYAVSIDMNTRLHSAGASAVHSSGSV